MAISWTGEAVLPEPVEGRKQVSSYKHQSPALVPELHRPEPVEGSKGDKLREHRRRPYMSLIWR